jgi:hypothetical protein
LDFGLWAIIDPSLQKKLQHRDYLKSDTFFTFMNDLINNLAVTSRGAYNEDHAQIVPLARRKQQLTLR